MTVFEIQINPERNALIRRALAKRIVRQREVEEEEASTEEDESFLGSSITIARKGSAASVSTTGSAGNREHHRIKTDGGGRMNAKSRWKSEYLRTRSSSPSPSGSSFMSAISEILPPEMLPEILPAAIVNRNNSLARPKTDGAPMETPPLKAADGGAATLSVTLNGAPLSSGDAATSTDQIPTVERAAKPEPEDTTLAPTAIEETGPDLVEQDLLLKLDDLKKEKSRLFALFRNALQKKEESSKSPQPHPLSQSTSQEPEALQEARQKQDKRGEALNPSGSRSVSSSTITATDRSSKDQETEYGRQGGASESRTQGRLSDQNHERRPEPLSRQNIKSRREYDRVIDRSKLNLEIPRKPSISSASSNSTSSTPTTSFAPPKRGRSRSPSVDGGGPFNSNSRGSSGPGSFGPSFPSTSYSSSSSHAESTPYPSKYPRADYLGSSQQQQHNRNSSSSSNNGLPDKPQGRYHTSSHFQQHAPSSARSLGGDSYHADEGGYSNRNKGSSSGPGSGMNGGSGGGSYRQNGPMSYHSQGPPPPTRIGFGDNSGSSGGSSSGRSGGSGNGGGGSGGGGGGNAVGRGGFYGHGHGHDGPPTAPISMLGPSGRTHMPFNRSMMQMPHSRGLTHGRVGFGNGSGGGGRNGGGPPDRAMSSARPGDWSRRRSRA